MGLRHLIPVVILIIQLYGVEVDAVNFPKLRDNKLFEGSARNLPGEHAELNCGKSKDARATIGSSLSLTQALTSANFRRYAFIAGALGCQRSPRVQGIEASFKFTVVKASKTMYALTVDPTSTGERAYWLPQGGVIDIPRHPTAAQPQYVFTPDFSGCSWTVTPMSNGNLRMRHVQGGHEYAEFNKKTEAEKGGDTTYAMQYVDYGYTHESTRVVKNDRAFAYMHYSGGSWQFHFQRQTCIARAGGCEFKNDVLSGMLLTDYYQSASEQISSVATYSIP